MFRAIFLMLILASGMAVSSQQPYVLLVSLDGFRWDYPQKSVTPNLDYMARNGVKAVSLKPSFPSKTFPNHYTIATGLYPDHHGIVNNEFFDPLSGKEFRMNNREAVEDPFFYGGEPIWVTAEKQQVTSACYFWVGSEAPVQGIYPTYWEKYRGDTPFENRIDTVVRWLSLPERDRPHLVTLYFDEPDATGHEFGPVSRQIDSIVHHMDSLLGILITQLKTLPFYKEINLIVLSDHGMAEISKEKTIYLSQHLNPEWIRNRTGGNPNYNLAAKEGYLDSAYLALSSIEHLAVWKSEEVPERLHYGTNPRCLDLVVTADSGWSVRWDPRGRYDYGGTHGYDPDYRDMHAIFYAMGPAFKVNHLHPTFNNVDIYPLIARILGIEPAKTDGQLKNVLPMLN